MNDLIPFYRSAYQRGRVRFLSIIGLMVLSGLLDGIGLTMFIPLLGSLFGIDEGGQSTDSIGTLLHGFFDALSLPVTPEVLLPLIVVIILTKSAIQYLQKILSFKVSLNYELDLKRKMYAAITGSRWHYLVQQKSGPLLNAMVVETRTVSSGYLQLMALTAEVISASCYTIFALLISWQVFLLLVLVFGPVSLLARRAFRLSREYGTRNVEVNAEIMNTTRETLHNAKYLKTQGLFPHIGAMFDNEAAKLRDVNYLFGRLSALFETMAEPISVTAIAGMIYLTYTFDLMPMASFIILILILHRTFGKVMMTQRIFQKAMKLVPSFEKCDAIMQDAVVHVEEASGSAAMERLERLELRDVRFSYSPDIPVLDGISVTLKRNALVALVGKSGGGKTTLADLLTGLMQPESGAVMLNGRPLSEYDLESWRSKIGYIPQEAALFTGTVGENIIFGMQNVSLERIEEAARLAHADEFISALPFGYDTQVGDRGTQLSGGQRQRIALARALIRSPELLILDEATSALDNESERQIQRTINELRHTMTILVIAHRLSTVRNVDYLYVVEDGRIREEGRPDDLLAEGSSRFAELYAMGDAMSEDDSSGP